MSTALSRLPLTCFKRHLLAALLLLFSPQLFANPAISEPHFSRLTVNEGLSQSTVKSLLLDRDGFLWLGTDWGLNRYDGYRVTQINGNDEMLSKASIHHLFQDEQGLIWIGTEAVGIFTLDPQTGASKRRIAQKHHFIDGLYQTAHQILQVSEDQLWIALDEKIISYNKLSGKMRTLFSLSDDEITSQRFVLSMEKWGDRVLVGTSAGLLMAESNGTQVSRIRFLPPQWDSLRANEIKALWLSAHGHLYIGTNDGLYQSRTADLAHVSAGESNVLPALRLIASRKIHDLLPQGNQLHIATDNGLFRHDVDTAITTHLFRPSDSNYGLSGDTLKSLAALPDGSLWIGSSAEGAFYWQITQGTFDNVNRRHSQLGNEMVWTFHQQEPGVLWIGTEDGLNRYDLRSGENQTIPPPVNLFGIANKFMVNQIVEAGDDKLWLWLEEGIVLLDITTGEYTPVLTKDNAPDAFLPLQLWHMYRRPDGHIWFMHNKGYFSIDPVSLEITPIPGLSAEQLDPELAWSFMGTLPGDDNGMLIGASHRLMRFDVVTKQLSTLHQVEHTSTEKYVYPQSWHMDDNNVLWVLYSGVGLLALDALSFEEKQRHTPENRLPTEEIFGLMADQQGNLWMGSLYGLISFDTASGQFKHFTSDQGFSNEEFNEGANIRLADDRLAYGGNKGVTIFDPNILSQKTAPIAAKVIISNVSLLSRNIQLPLTDLDGTHLELEYDDVGLGIEFSTLTFSRHHRPEYRYELSGSRNIAYPRTVDNQIIFPSLPAGNYQFKVWSFSAETGDASKPALISIKVRPAPWATAWAYVGYASALALIIITYLWRNHRHEQQLLRAHEQTRNSENSMQLALRGSNSGIWEWDTQRQVFLQIREVLAEAGHQLNQDPTLPQYLELVHPDDRAILRQKWHAVIADLDAALDATYRIRAHNMEYIWLRTQAKWNPVNGQPRLIGTYTDVSEFQSHKERARLFGRIFETTHDWVLVFDAKRRLIDANSAALAIAEATGERQLSAVEHLLNTNPQCHSTLMTYLSQLKLGEHWHGELSFDAPSGREYLVEADAYAMASGIYETSLGYFAVILADITERKAAQTELERLASFDELTGLPNRVLLLDRMQHAIQQAVRRNQNFAVMFIDLDRFKQVNDSLGHDAGDDLLKQIATRLSGCLRDEDTVARLSGDEFVVMLEGVGADQANAIATKLVEQIELPVKLGEEVVSVTSSIGIAIYPDDGDSADQLIKHADIAMYHAKGANRASVAFFQEQMNQQVHRRLQFVNAVKSASQAGAFYPHYQPVIDIVRGKVITLELLMRWHDGERQVSPGEFIPVAEEINLIVPMTRQVLQQGFADLRNWYEQGFTPKLSINLSARHFDEAGLVEELLALLTQFDLPTSALSLEITESALMSDHQRALQMMQQLNQAGFHLALDDFGTGYSSLKYLQQFPIDIIKVDQSFVSAIGQSKSVEGIINATLKMAESLGMDCVAEGIETPEQSAFLQQRECFWQQGYLFSKPLPAEAIPAILAKDHRLPGA